MFILEKKKHGTAFRTIWYAKQPLKKAGINRYRYAEFHPQKDYQVMNTFVSDLTEADEDIVQRISKNGRYEIRRAVKEGVTCEYKVGSEITNQDIEEFAQFFSDFWKSKGIENHNKEGYIEEIKEYVSKEAFAISVAKMGDKILIYHTYIVGEEFARLYQSASQFRVDESIPPVIVAMANRLLHKEDMLFFKRLGKTFYDWGGAGQGADVASVTHFKKSFGGTPKEIYDFEEVIGIKAKVVKAVIKLLERY
ncbi:MAG: peptidoglycan bridge formation glycyltransferase FemA/FemB family protein [Clostridiales bacterium]|nr:peptidoglycan bridge formation glycyltransferase FemA/FemB family protein [Clostridiales bacterium]